MSKRKQWDKVTSDKAADLVTAAELDPVSADLLQAETRPEELIHALAEAQQWQDAIRVMSRALPTREAVWWACVCARQMKTLATDENEMAALDAAEKWVYRPTDKNRRAAFQAAEESEVRSAGTLAALSVALNDNRIPLPEEQYADVEPQTFGQTVAAAVMVAACEKGGENMHSQFSVFLNSGEDIACGGNGKVKGIEAGESD